MMRLRWMSIALAMCLALAMLPGVAAEDEAVYSVPVDEAVTESAETEVWTEEIAKDVEDFETAKRAKGNDYDASDF